MLYYECTGVRSKPSAVMQPSSVVRWFHCHVNVYASLSSIPHVTQHWWNVYKKFHWNTTQAQTTASKMLNQHFSVNVLLDSQRIQVCEDTQEGALLESGNCPGLCPNMDVMCSYLFKYEARKQSVTLTDNNANTGVYKSASSLSLQISATDTHRWSRNYFYATVPWMKKKRWEKKRGWLWVSFLYRRNDVRVWLGEWSHHWPDL